MAGIDRDQGQDGDGAEMRQFLTFRVGDDEYGVPIMAVREIKGWIEPTRLPNLPAFIRGVINLRGLIVPIFDLRARFTDAATEATAKHVTIIVAHGSRNLGVLVDAVSDILTVPETEIRPAPDMNVVAGKDFVSGLILLESRIVALLDINRLFDARQVDSLIEGAA